MYWHLAGKSIWTDTMLEHLFWGLYLRFLNRRSCITKEANDYLITWCVGARPTAENRNEIDVKLIYCNKNDIHFMMRLRLYIATSPTSQGNIYYIKRVATSNHKQHIFEILWFSRHQFLTFVVAQGDLWPLRLSEGKHFDLGISHAWDLAKHLKR